MPVESTAQRVPALHDNLPQQEAHVRVLHSNERQGLTPVFGTAVPPSGLSGRLRTWAFRYSEGDVRHWMILLAADRVNVLEGLWSDLTQGRLPNPVSEMGLATEWRYRRGPLVAKVAAGGALLALVVWSLRRRRR